MKLKQTLLQRPGNESIRISAKVKNKIKLGNEEGYKMRKIRAFYHSYRSSIFFWIN